MKRLASVLLFVLAGLLSMRLRLDSYLFLSDPPRYTSAIESPCHTIEGDQVAIYCDTTAPALDTPSYDKQALAAPDTPQWHHVVTTLHREPFASDEFAYRSGIDFEHDTYLDGQLVLRWKGKP